jgi:RNA polymerase sigma-70 factor, ECF subfamily
MPDSVTEDEIIAVYRATIDTLYGYVSRRCDGQRTLTEDITQDVWLRAVRDWHRNGIPDSPIAWLTTVARNLLLNNLRRAPSLSLDEVSARELFDFVERDDAHDDGELARRLDDALSRLPEHESRLLHQFHYQRCRVAQLAGMYGVSERAIEGRLRRARERLRAEVENMLPKPDIQTISRTGAST